MKNLKELINEMTHEMEFLPVGKYSKIWLVLTGKEECIGWDIDIPALHLQNINVVINPQLDCPVPFPRRGSTVLLLCSIELGFEREDEFLNDYDDDDDKEKNKYVFRIVHTCYIYNIYEVEFGKKQLVLAMEENK